MAYILVGKIKCQHGIVRSVRFTVSGEYCLTCGSDGKVKLWNPHREALLKTYGGHGDQVMDACASCDSAHIASCSMDKSVIVWDVATGNPLRRFRGHAGYVMSVRFNEQSNMLVSGSRDNSLKLWDVRSRSREAVVSLDDAKDAVSSVRVSAHEILSGSSDGRIRIYDLRAGQLIVDRMPDAVTCASFTGDGRCVLASCADGTIRLITKDSGQLLGEFRGHRADNLCLESSVDNEDARVISGSADGRLWIWDLFSQRVVAKLLARENFPTVSMSVHPRRNLAAASSGDDVYLWERTATETEESAS